LPKKPDPRYLAIDGMKLCRDCECVKPVREFYSHKQDADGFRGDCKECARARVRDHYQRNREQILARDKEQNLEKIRREGRTYGRRRRPEKYPVADGMKRCTACDQVLPVAEFLPKGKNRPGLRPECRICTKKRDRESYQNSQDRYLKSSREQWRSADDATRAKWAERHRERRRSDPEWSRDQDIRRTVRRYGLTPEDADALLAAQGGLCPICGGDPTAGFSRRPHIDHDHETGAVRGILCANCNVGLGNFKDDIARLEAAIAYLRNPPASRLKAADDTAA